MIFEHYAINVDDPRAMAEWYGKHLGLRIVSQMEQAPFTTFLADSTGRVACELYNQPDFGISDFASQHPLTFHVAFESTDAEADKNRLVAEGATLVDDATLPDGSHLVMLRDPWGVALQLCQRAKRMNTI